MQFTRSRLKPLLLLTGSVSSQQQYTGLTPHIWNLCESDSCEAIDYGKTVSTRFYAQALRE